MELNVKVGEKLMLTIYSWRFRNEKIVTVKKITPTGRIKLEENDHVYNKFGELISPKTVNVIENLKAPTTKDFTRIYNNDVIKKARYILINMEDKELSLDEAKKIIELFGKGDDK